MAFCTHCGAQIPDGAKFCTSCGTPVAAPQAAPRTAQAPPQRPAAQAAPIPPAPQPAPPPKPFVEAPAEAGEFAAIQWDEPGSEAQPQPYAQAPQYAQSQYGQPQQPYAQPYPQQPYAQPAPAGKKEKKKKPFIVRLLLWLILIAILAYVAYYINDNYLLWI